MLYGEYPPLTILNYIWSSSAPLGFVLPNPYSDRSIMVVVESGEKNLNALEPFFWGYQSVPLYLL